MRDKLNNNPIAQVAIVGVLIVVGGFMVMKTMKKDSPPPAPTLGSEGTAVVATGAGAAPPTDPAAAATVASATDPAAAASAASATGAIPQVPGPPLPPAVDAAYRSGKVVAVLVVRGGGPDDRLLRRSVAALRQISGVAVFGTRASGIARYTQITQGASVDRVPALIVVRPQGGGTGVAEVRYGFRSAESVVQAVRDVLYRGPNVGYSPD